MSVSLWSRVTPQQTFSIREGLRMARKIFANEPQASSGLTTSELYQLMLKEKPVEGFAKYDVKQIAFGKAGAKIVTPPLPPHPEHPIRSMSFLKRQVLPILEGNKEIRLATTTRIPTTPQAETKQQQVRGKGKNKAATASVVAAPSPVTVRLWKPVTHPVMKTKEVNWGPYAKSFKPEGHEVGVGEDWGHLNRRRKRTRLEVVKRDRRVMVTTKKLEALAAFQKEREGYEALKQRRWMKKEEKNRLRRERKMAEGQAA